ncbi:hypothetical protein PC116_g9412 [Phytophthora cactorum]|uniref:Uncharacterized protein n=1 Tax=Phytophthora cactorum TaxID=29920 RepID=A0A329SSA6_9STRA|nr:hypothetical protein Pcac1_g25814 [Phytophthora cactorum]KAG3107188.1 hypothetical protein PI125_g12956 [Phytophthora idaei]KAG2894676.1 hypothetical protein PC114_g15801 [Phytophthora cactorum]KAG2895861.1 hypothetical protein PC117_g23130 [Phytophthora cactorum]KAG2991912.1 hypothetical protein PC120_g22603 [Phytophthora cactorum]
MVHLVTFGYIAAYAMFYYELQKTYLYTTFEYIGIENITTLSTM